MVWIEAHAAESLTIRGPRDRIRAVILDVPTSGRFVPGIDHIEDLGDQTYRWQVRERRTLGISFVGRYVSKYRREGDDVVWETLEGNMRTRGRWTLRGPDGRVQVRIETTIEVDAPVPRLLKRPAAAFAAKEARDGLKAQLARLKATVEAS